MTPPQNWIQSITGPAGALVLAVFVLYALNSWISFFADRHFKTVDQILQSHEEDRKIYKENMKQFSEDLRSCCD